MLDDWIVQEGRCDCVEPNIWLHILNSKSGYLEFIMLVYILFSIVIRTLFNVETTIRDLPSAGIVLLFAKLITAVSFDFPSSA